MKRTISIAFALTLAAQGAHAAKKEDPKAKAAIQMVNAAANFVAEMTKDQEGSGKKKAGKPAKKPAGKPAVAKANPKAAAAKTAAAKKAAAGKAGANAASAGEEIEADPVDVESDPIDQAAMDEQVALERSMVAMEEAQALYSTRCQVCHGATGRGDGAAAAGLNPRPHDYRDKTWLKRFSDESLSEAIVEGGASIGESALMPPNPDLKNKPEVVKALVAMIRSF